MEKYIRSIIQSRRKLVSDMPRLPLVKSAEEGGCGVVGFASSVPVSGRHIFEPSIQMHNRGNGKGGGIAAAGFRPEQLGVDAGTLAKDYILQVALLDPQSEKKIEEEAVTPYLEIHRKTALKPEADYRDFGLECAPPDILRYFVRVKEDVLEKFAEENDMADIEPRKAEDEFIYQNSVRLNRRFYSSLGEKSAFVLSHGRDLMIFKIVGYAEQVVQYYGLENLGAQVWIAHQRYPTKGRVWHPAGAHPFIGLNEALVHNGDFANFHSVSEYLRQHGIAPQFLTDTEVSVLLFDLLDRVYGYPLEYLIESLAPTTELDLEELAEERKQIYRAVQALHMHGSPDGPWFFIIARSNPDLDRLQLLGITDTSMLRPQVFAMQEGDVSIGLIGSEKQAIDATLSSLASEDNRFRSVADRYWNARGGSHTDGGAFAFNVIRNNGHSKIECADKFGHLMPSTPGDWKVHMTQENEPPPLHEELSVFLEDARKNRDPMSAFSKVSSLISGWNFQHLRWLTGKLTDMAGEDDGGISFTLGTLTLLNDRRYNCGGMKRSAVLEVIRDAIDEILDNIPSIEQRSVSKYVRIDYGTRGVLRPPDYGENTLVVCAWGFPPEGEEANAAMEAEAYRLGWRRFIVYGLRGQRFTGCGFGPDTSGVKIDVYGSSGDYLAGGADGMEIRVHDNGQDQLAQVMKCGKLVVHGDVGQAFMYGAKGGEVYVMGSAAGRPLINAVGKPRVVINGACLDYLAESFMAGDPHNGGGFVVLNGVEFDDYGNVKEQESPYPGSNLFSLASGGAIYVRDPHRKLVSRQLNGGEFADMEERDWELIRPYLEENERRFGISIERDLLAVDGQKRSPLEVYRKVRAVQLGVLAKETAPE